MTAIIDKSKIIQVTTVESNGINLDTLPQTLTYSSNKLTTVVVSYEGATYTKTYTYTGTDLTGISAWVKS